MQPRAVTGGMSCETARCETMAVVVQATAQEIVDSYADIMTEQYTSRMARKLGLREYRKELAVGLITLMYEDKADFTNTFRAMAAVSADDEPSTVPAALDEVSLKPFLPRLPGASCERTLNVQLWWAQSDVVEDT